MDRPELFVPLDREVQLSVRVILETHPKLIDTRKGRSGADPWVIGLALAHDCVVVSGEHPTGRDDKPNIPDVCATYDVQCISLLELLRVEGWQL